MALVKRSEPSFMTAAKAAQRVGYAAQSELALREALESFCRDRWPDARIVHELVMGEGKVRADVVAIDTTHIAAFEVKGSYDDTTRLLHQVGMFQLCVPEVWMVVAENHEYDASLIMHLLPSVGLIVAKGMDRGYRWGQGKDPVEITVTAEPEPRAVVIEMMLNVLWANELRAICGRLNIACNARTTRAHAIKGLAAHVSVDELKRECCAELRARDALWRADAPMSPNCNTGEKP